MYQTCKEKYNTYEGPQTKIQMDIFWLYDRCEGGKIKTN